MRNRFTSLLVLGATWGLSSAATAAEQPGSYAANGKCFCNLPVAASLSAEIVSTPIGGQSLMQVCERVGTGPELVKTGDTYNFSVYGDMQCGHGPGLVGFSALLHDAGMSQNTVGPKWDMEGAYSTRASSVKTASKDYADAANGDIVQSGRVARLKSRYIDVPTSSEAETASDVATARINNSESVAKKPVAATERFAVPTKTANTELSKERNRDIESLPLAVLEPLEGVSSSKKSSAPVAEASTTNTVENTGSVTQDNSTLVQKEIETVAQVISQPKAQPKGIGEATSSTALRIPAVVSARSRQFEYLSVAPTGYDFGGTGVQFSASALNGDSYRMLVRAGLAEDYQEALFGTTYLLTLGNSDRVTIGVSGGFEYGRFNLQAGNVSTNPSSLGVFVRAQSIVEVSRRFELQGGVGYSSFFNGDPHVFGAALFHMTQKLDFIGEFEAGDNDSAGLGIRYYYR